MSITLQHLNKHFGHFQALSNINLNVPTGKLTSLLGPSGCGKTTLLRIIAGLEHADSGTILFDGQDVTTKHVRERKVGFVFQHYALFRHMNVFDNIAFGLSVLPKAERPGKETIRAKVEELLSLVQLSHLAKSYPHQLSGGQRQRIALARALAVSPKLLLLDEPFGALDAKVRKELRAWLRQLHQRTGHTTRAGDATDAVHAVEAGHHRAPAGAFDDHGLQVDGGVDGAQPRAEMPAGDRRGDRAGDGLPVPAQFLRRDHPVRLRDDHGQPDRPALPQRQ